MSGFLVSIVLTVRMMFRNWFTLICFVVNPSSKALTFSHLLLVVKRKSFMSSRIVKLPLADVHPFFRQAGLCDSLFRFVSHWVQLEFIRSFDIADQQQHCQHSYLWGEGCFEPYLSTL